MSAAVKGLTPVQAKRLRQLAAPPHNGKAIVGRGMPYKCNRITARSLADLGLVVTDAEPVSRGEPPPFTIELTAAGCAAAALLAGTK